MLTKQGTPGLTMLEPEMEKIDPDDAFSRVPYEKGSLFLFYLEQIVGGEDLMTEWLRDYVETFREKSLETSDMKKHFLKFFKGQKRLKEIDWEHWLHGEGLPDFKLSDYVDCSLVDESSSLAESWLKTSTSAAETKHMKAQQWMLFLDRLINEVTDGQSISHDALAAMDTQYSFSSSGNVEVLFRPLESFKALSRQVVLAWLQVQVARDHGAHEQVPGQPWPRSLCEAPRTPLLFHF